MLHQTRNSAPNDALFNKKKWRLGTSIAPADTQIFSPKH